MHELINPFYFQFKPKHSPSLICISILFPKQTQHEIHIKDNFLT